MIKLQTKFMFSEIVYLVSVYPYFYSVKQLVVFKGPGMLLPNIFWFRISFRTLSSFFRVVIFSVCGFCCGDACLD